MCEAFLALFIVAAAAFLIEIVHKLVHSLLRKHKGSSGAFIVIPLRRDTDNIEMTVREMLQKTADIDPAMKIYVWNIDGECEALTICQKLMEDVGGFEIVDNLTSGIL